MSNESIPTALGGDNEIPVSFRNFRFREYSHTDLRIISVISCNSLYCSNTNSLMQSSNKKKSTKFGKVRGLFKQIKGKISTKDTASSSVNHEANICDLEEGKSNIDISNVNTIYFKEFIQDSIEDASTECGYSSKDHQAHFSNKPEGIPKPANSQPSKQNSPGNASVEHMESSPNSFEPCIREKQQEQLNFDSPISSMFLQTTKMETEGDSMVYESWCNDFPNIQSLYASVSPRTEVSRQNLYTNYWNKLHVEQNRSKVWSKEKEEIFQVEYEYRKILASINTKAKYEEPKWQPTIPEDEIEILNVDCKSKNPKNVKGKMFNFKQKLRSVLSHLRLPLFGKRKGTKSSATTKVSYRTSVKEKPNNFKCIRPKSLANSKIRVKKTIKFKKQKPAKELQKKAQNIKLELLDGMEFCELCSLPKFLKPTRNICLKKDFGNRIVFCRTRKYCQPKKLYNTKKEIKLNLTKTESLNEKKRVPLYRKSIRQGQVNNKKLLQHATKKNRNTKINGSSALDLRFKVISLESKKLKLGSQKVAQKKVNVLPKTKSITRRRVVAVTLSKYYQHPSRVNPQSKFYKYTNKNNALKVHITPQRRQIIDRKTLAGCRKARLCGLSVALSKIVDRKKEVVKPKKICGRYRPVFVQSSYCGSKKPVGRPDNLWYSYAGRNKIFKKKVLRKH